MVINDSVNSALISGQMGLQQSFDGLTQSAVSLAQKSAQQEVASNGTTDLLADVSLQSLSTVSQLLPSDGDSITSELMSMQIYSNNAKASAKVIGVANDVVGNLIDTLA